MAILVKSDSARNFEDLPPTQRCIDSVYIRRGCDRKRFNSAAFIKNRGIQSPGQAGGASLQRLWVAPKVHHLHLQKQWNDLDEQEVYRHRLRPVLVRELDMLIFAQSTSYMSFWVRRPLTRFWLVRQTPQVQNNMSQSKVFSWRGVQAKSRTCNFVSFRVQFNSHSQMFHLRMRKKIGTLPVSKTSTLVEHGGVVGKWIIQLSQQVSVSELANTTGFLQR